MTRKIQLHQWPNLLGIDAALIAIAWQAAFAKSLDATLNWPACIVLGLSVWLTYMADRLFDVSSRPLQSLQSFRHQFAKHHRIKLWWIWWGVLLLDGIAATQLSLYQFKGGVMLLVICILYTLLNQNLSRRFFPKEICVALIYGGGIVVFIQAPIPIGLSLSFIGLCLINCLMISAREKKIDANMQVHSVASFIPKPYLSIIVFACPPILFLAAEPLNNSLAASSIMLTLLYIFRMKTTVENFRVFADTALLIGAFF